MSHPHEDEVARMQEEAAAFGAAVTGVMTQFESTALRPGTVPPSRLAEMTQEWGALAIRHPRYTHQIDSLSTAIIAGLRAEPTVEPLTHAGIDVALQARGVADRKALRLLHLMVLARHTQQRVPYTQDAEAIVDGLSRHGADGFPVRPGLVDARLVVGAVLRSKLNPGNLTPVRKRRPQPQA